MGRDEKKKKINFWQDHSLNYLEMAFNAERCEIIENPDGYGKKVGECDDTVEIFLSVKNNIIESLSFNTIGCINTNACANTIGALSEGKSLENAWNITPEDVVAFLETLPPEDIHCAELAVGTFYIALTDAQKNKTEHS